MKRFGRNSETAKLRRTLKTLPSQVADWTPEQRRQYTEQADRATREQAGITEPAPARRGFFRRG
ncbi:hypothetical protein ACFSUJ_12190 [Streptomyces lusitanus]|uniref:Uncharacterized protein n=1 Tax=Streptomyces lusitanus TaxID=68232 RepID=A0ABU3JP81_9ACTN|nr:hypothetical protein [Streptomyces lusitanus]